MNDIEKAIDTLENYSPCSQKGLYEAHKIAISALKKQLNGGWIPIIERLPEEGHYLISLKHKEFDETDVDLSHYDDEGGFQLRDYMQKRWWEVIAWQPLPEPYKEVEQ
jgi:hypothetical protein